jgi:ABC-type transport system involved in cytochrome c biogenesis permease subunit
MPMLDEHFFLYTACVAYTLGLAAVYLARPGFRHQAVIALCLLGLVSHSLSLGLRWDRVGHGPFINLYEILSSNLWSLMLAFVLFMLLARRHRQAGRYIAPLLVLLMAWLLVSTPRDTFLPATYDTLWLYFHVLSGKFFLGLLMLATGLAVFEMVASGAGRDSASAVESLSYRLLAFAFCFESLMLLFGAIWAQDAWGRYWAWDPLETWAFLTWLAVIFALHWRLNHSRRDLYAGLVVGCFVLAFLTFFGVPFVSTAPHKGMI